jgi:hypothetical protein
MPSSPGLIGGGGGGGGGSPAFAARRSFSDVVLEVEVPGGAVVDLPVRVGDAPVALASEFAARHGLPARDVHTLAELITPRLLQAYEVELAAARRGVADAVRALDEANARRGDAVGALEEANARLAARPGARLVPSGGAGTAASAADYDDVRAYALSQKDATDFLLAAAFVSADGTTASAVVANPTNEAQDFKLLDSDAPGGARAARATLPAHSIATFTWAL